MKLRVSKYDIPNMKLQDCKMRTVKSLYMVLMMFTLLLWLPAMAGAAGKADAGGYPLMYLRGTFNNWAQGGDTQSFTRSGKTYTVTVDELDGEWKVSNSDWSLNYGGESQGVIFIGDGTVKGVQDGDNYVARKLKNVTITFDLDSTGTTTIVVKATREATVAEGVSGTLPVLYITTMNENGTLNDEINSYTLAHKNYIAGSYWLDLNGCQWMQELGAKSIGSASEPLPLQIKARGNYTRTGFPKKPFKLKLEKKQSLLGLSKSKHFALMAGADDNYGYLCNYLGFDLGHRIGLPWTPSQMPVEVVINGDYRGLYLLTESIRLEKDRVNITEMADNETDALKATGGYIVELDNYDEANQLRLDEKTCIPGQYCDKLRITFDTPEELSSVQQDFLKQQFTLMNDYVGACSDSLWQYIDQDDLARFYLVHELMCDHEAFHGSTYMFRDAGEGQKWHFSPLWDLGSSFLGSTSNYFFINSPYGNTWIRSMLKNAALQAKVKATWLWFMHSCYPGVADDVQAFTSRIAQAAIADHKRWGSIDVPSGQSAVVDNSDIAAKRATVLTKLSEKIAWLSKQYGDYTTSGTSTEPARDTTPAAPLPGRYSGVIDVAAPTCNAPATYYNLEGVQVTTLTPGHIYIVKRGTHASKVVIMQ